MRIHSIASASLQSAAQIADTIGIVGDEALRGPLIAVPSALPEVADHLQAAAAAAAGGTGGWESTLKAIEERHFDVVRRIVDLRRQSQVIASIRQQVNLLDDLLGGIALIRELSPRTLDMVLAYGEWLSAYVFCEGLRERKPDVRFIDATQVLVTDGQFTQAKVRIEESRRLAAARVELTRPGTAVWTSLGATATGETTTFGRGGSRYAASVLAAVLGAAELVVWTDTDGIMTADPRKVPTARTIPCTSYVEAMEMMHFGGDFLYPPALIPAVTHGIPIRVVNSFHPDHPGTLVQGDHPRAGLVTGISSLDGIALLQIRGSGMIGVTGVAMRLFAALAGADVNVILISQASSEHSICVGIREVDGVVARAAVEQAFRTDIEQHLIDEVSVECGFVIVAVVAENVKGTMGLAATIFGTLGEARVNVRAVAQGSSALNVSIVVVADDETKALNALHRSLFEKGGPGR
jgi:bifunctional aspartokinase / homoserine dehydrogenase 1